jgi:hypothetical protein
MGTSKNLVFHKTLSLKNKDFRQIFEREIEFLEVALCKNNVLNLIRMGLPLQIDVSVNAP